MRKLLVAGLGLLCLAAQAADGPDPARLKALENEVQQTTAERDRLRAQSAVFGREADALRTQMIDLAREIQDLERSLNLMDARIADLERQGSRMSETLKDRDAQMTEVLMALERLALHPGDALALNPLSPDNAIRSAILLRAALPHIQQSGIALQAELAELYKIRAQTAAEKENAAAVTAGLVVKRQRLESLERDKTTQHLTLASRSEELDQRAAAMAREARDLRDLFARLAEERSRREGAPQSRPAADTTSRDAAAASPAKPEIDGPAARAGSTKAEAGLDTSVTRPFTQARGSMTFPVAGTVTAKYGAAGTSAEDASLRAKGITITTRAGAAVVAPYDGVVAFAGPFRGYGRLLIIEHSEGYHSLLAGLGRIDAAVGQHILAGEPVGVMEDDGAPSLYVELRRDGQPINPLPWLADRSGKAG